MNTLLVFGAGGHGKSVADAALSTGRWESVAFADDNATEPVMGFPVIASLKEAQKLSHRYAEVFVALGNNALRLEWMNKLQAAGFDLPTVLHNKSVVSPFASIGIGTVVMAGAIINADTSIGKGCILNTGCTVDHDCRIGNGVHISPGAHLGGNATVGNRTWMCIGASVAHGLRIGGDCIIAAGAALVSNADEGWLYTGIPAKRKKKVAE